jgi:hypothetical protein
MDTGPNIRNKLSRGKSTAVFQSMAGGDRSQAAALTEALFCILALLGAVFIAFATGQTLGVGVGRNEVTVRDHYEREKKHALTACSGAKGTAAVECATRIIEAAQEKSETKQGLYAQQDAAKWAYWAMLATWVTFAVTSLGVWFVKATLNATLQAVRDTDISTRAMVRQTILIENNQRPFLALSFSEEEFCNEFRRTYTMGFMGEDRYENFVIYADIYNVGTSPAYDVSGNFALGWYSEDESDLNKQSFAIPAIGPGSSSRQKLVCHVPSDRPDFSVVGILIYNSFDQKTFVTNTKWIRSDRSLTMTIEPAFIPSSNPDDHRRS